HRLSRLARDWRNGYVRRHARPGCGREVWPGSVAVRGVRRAVLALCRPRVDFPLSTLILDWLEILLAWLTAVGHQPPAGKGAAGMTEMNASPTSHEHGEGHGSDVTYLKVFGVLVVCTAVSFFTVMSLWVNNLGETSGHTVVMLVAVFKATLVAMFFMHLRQ